MSPPRLPEWAGFPRGASLIKGSTWQSHIFLMGNLETKFCSAQSGPYFEKIREMRIILSFSNLRINSWLDKSQLAAMDFILEIEDTYIYVCFIQLNGFPDCLLWNNEMDTLGKICLQTPETLSNRCNDMLV
ncbi:hypothetical protein XENTR_v10016028 [Xenopus tropicalis]|nr:hypothetical protein XENTR_v10016028 [Xenopus tropicalis]